MATATIRRSGGPYQGSGAPEDDVFQTLFKRRCNAGGCIDDASAWLRFVDDLAAHGCLSTGDAGDKERRCLDRMFTHRTPAEGQPDGVSYDEFVGALMAAVETDADRAVASLLTDGCEQAVDLSTMVVSWRDHEATSAEEVVRREAMHGTLATLLELQSAALRDTAAACAAHGHAIRLQRQRRLLQHPSLSGDGAEGVADSALDFQRLNGAGIEDYLRKHRARPASMTLVSNLLATSATLGHWLPLPADLKARLADPAQLAAVKAGPDLLARERLVLSGSACYAVEGDGDADALRRRGRSYLLAHTHRAMEVVRCPLSAPTAVTTALYNSYVAHRQLTLSQYLPSALGSFSWSPGSAPQGEPPAIDSRGATAAPTAADAVTPAPYVAFVYEFVDGAVSLGHLVDTYGPLCESQPCFKLLLCHVVQAVCDVDLQCTSALVKPLTLHNVFVSSPSMRVTLGRVEWGRPLDATAATAPHQLRARSRLLAMSLAHMLCRLLRRPPSQAEDSSVDATRHDDAGRRVFPLPYAKHGIHIADGETVVLALPPWSDEPGMAWTAAAARDHAPARPSTLRLPFLAASDTDVDPVVTVGNLPAPPLDAASESDAFTGDDWDDEAVPPPAPATGRVLLPVTAAYTGTAVVDVTWRAYREVEDGRPVVVQVPVTVHPVAVSPVMSTLLQAFSVAAMHMEPGVGHSSPASATGPLASPRAPPSPDTDGGVGTDTAVGGAGAGVGAGAGAGTTDGGDAHPLLAAISADAVGSDPRDAHRRRSLLAAVAAVDDEHKDVGAASWLADPSPLKLQQLRHHPAFKPPDDVEAARVDFDSHFNAFPEEAGADMDAEVAS